MRNGASQIFKFLEANVAADAAAILRGGTSTVEAAAKKAVARGRQAFLLEAPAAMANWKDQSGVNHARNKIKNEVINGLKRKVLADEASEPASSRARGEPPGFPPGLA